MHESMDYLDHQDDQDDDEVLFESDEFAGRERPEAKKDAQDDPVIADDLPVLPLRGVVVYPMMWLPLTIGQARSLRLVEEALPESRIIALVTSKDETLEEPGPEQIHLIGTAAQVHRVLRAPDGVIRLAIQGLERIRIKEYIQSEPYLRARVEILPEHAEENLELEALSRAVQDLFRRFVELDHQTPDELSMMAMNVENARQLAYLVAASSRLPASQAQEILEMDAIREKLLRLIQHLNKEVEVLELGRKIQSQAQGEMERMQRDFFLREQLKAIQKELGEEDEQAADIRDLDERISAAGLSEEASKEARRELDRMRRMPIQAAEYSVIKTYLDLLVSLPWQKTTSDKLDIRNARQVLDEDHYGLQEIKERILEYLAVRKLRAERRQATAASGPPPASGAEEEEGEHRAPNGAAAVVDGDGVGLPAAAEPLPAAEDDVRDRIRREREGVVLCFVGPPGVGKTSLGISIARAMGRKFVRLALGGIRDEAEVRGFRRTYIGSMPGRIIQSLRRIESKNPVFMLDEVDKLGRDFRGDPSSALLEVLDPEQNREFRDHYLDVSFDLSQVMFITTANVLDTIPSPLRDRMEIIQLSSYTEDEKVQIAQGYLAPRQIRENGLRPDEISFSDGAIREVIQGYTREAGVRGMEREIGKICRKVAAKVAAGDAMDPVALEGGDVVTFLGKRKIHSEEILERTQMPGVAIGLAWTMTGGDILFFEATRSQGRKGFMLTGQLGEVMKESAQAALSYVRSRAEALGVSADFFEHTDIHLHIPAGAIPKDGPSAGITMVTSLASLLTGRMVKPNIGMTGEITLRGKVLPIGGIKEKVLAAARFGLNTVILPKRNEADLDDVPETVREKMRFVLVDTVDEVLEAALGERTEPPVDAQPITAADAPADHPPLPLDAPIGENDGHSQPTEAEILVAARHPADRAR